MYGSLVSGEIRSGTAVLVLTKPLSRTAFVIAKAAVHSLFLVCVVVAGALLTWALTWLIFGRAPAAPLWSATGAFLVLGLVFVALMTLLSVLIGSAAGAAGAGLGGLCGALDHGYLETARHLLPGRPHNAARVAGGW